MNLNYYDTQDYYDEYILSSGKPRPEVASIVEWLQTLSPQELQHYQETAQKTLADRNVTFKAGDEERVFPFDLIPRVIPADQWQYLKQGLQQRVTALNLFCADIYDRQLIVKDGIVPQEIIDSAVNFIPECRGMKPPSGVWCHISGTDLVRDRDGKWYVLEDNLRVPSGVSYTLENRRVMELLLPQLLEKLAIAPVKDYPQQLLKTLLNSAPKGIDEPNVVVFSPGKQSSAYFEHAYLAQQMGVALAEAQNLMLKDGYLQLRTAEGLRRVDVIYRRGDQELFDSLNLGSNHSSGTAAIADLCQQGKLAIANALGTGVADDKVIYAYVPKMIRYYLNEEPILPNVPTYLCWEAEDRQYVLDHLDELVVKSASEEGGHGMLVGIQASASEREEFAEKIRSYPRRYMAQPTICLSHIPTIFGDRLEGRHTDLRPYIIHQGDEIYVYPGGLTRVAMEKGKLVVNSSQGGGSKDTWVKTTAS
ncbi:circularly permuted type 2 ATP-grasp protein [Pleurocapsales cyanobacterium LEGE 10410]|nr:circularly permuted type 2 ATP-grasp protein [Pleurocapsales cyanobacterium LEGE 10410]